jgi:hypothetical protein
METALLGAILNAKRPEQLDKPFEAFEHQRQFEALAQAHRTLAVISAGKRQRGAHDRQLGLNL